MPGGIGEFQRGCRGDKRVGREEGVADVLRQAGGKDFFLLLVRIAHLVSIIPLNVWSDIY